MPDEQCSMITKCKFFFDVFIICFIFFWISQNISLIFSMLFYLFTIFPQLFKIFSMLSNYLCFKNNFLLFFKIFPFFQNIFPLFFKIFPFFSKYFLHLVVIANKNILKENIIKKREILWEKRPKRDGRTGYFVGGWVSIINIYIALSPWTSN